MFSVDVTETDAFYSLPPKAQALYFHLGMRADDDGFVASPIRSCGASKKELKQLEQSGYIILFKSGVLVITDWKVNNFLRKDRHTRTIYQNELSELQETTSGRYIKSATGAPMVNQVETNGQPDCQPNGNHLEPQYSIEENRVVEISIAEQQRPTAPPAAVAPHKGALGGMTALGSSLEEDRDAETEAARQRFLDSIKRPAWATAEAAPPDAEKKE